MRPYGKAAAEAIIGDHFPNVFEIRDDGVWPSKDGIEYFLPWSPSCDLEGPHAPDPLEAPNLPIPFSANDLAAFMLDGVGAGLASVYGAWESGPDGGMLDSLGIRGRKAKEALVAAYAAYRNAESIVGSLDWQMESHGRQLARELDDEEDKANARESVFEGGIQPEISRTRRKAALASISQLIEARTQADLEWRTAFVPWRKAMVNQLLQPAEVDIEQSDESRGVDEADFILGFYGENDRLKIGQWARMMEVSPRDAAKVLCGEDPLSAHTYADSADIKMLAVIFADWSKNQPARRALKDWARIALDVGAQHCQGISRAALHMAVNTQPTAPPETLSSEEHACIQVATESQAIETARVAENSASEVPPAVPVPAASVVSSASNVPLKGITSAQVAAIFDAMPYKTTGVAPFFHHSPSPLALLGTA